MNRMNGIGGAVEKIQGGVVCVALACVLSLGCSPAETEGQAAPAPEPADVTSTAPLVVPAPGAMAPNLTLAGDGQRALLSFLVPKESGAEHLLRVAEVTLEGGAPVLGALQTVAEGADFFANWADLPAVVETGDGTRYGHWLTKLGEDTYAYGAALARSTKSTAPFERAGWLHDDTSPSEHGFVSYVGLEGSRVRAFWLDGRLMPDGGSMQLRTAVVGEEGAAAKQAPVSELLDERVCECCSTDAVRSGDQTLVVYRDRSDAEIRDISVIRETDGAFGEPVTVHSDGWRIAGCPVNGPAIDASGEHVAVAWFSAAEKVARVKVAFSKDGGASFDAPVLVDEVRPLGRVDLVVTPEGDAVVSWLDREGKEAAIRFARVARDTGTVSAFQDVVQTSAARSAGVPKMVRVGEHLLFAWVADAEPRTVQLGSVPLL